MLKKLPAVLHLGGIQQASLVLLEHLMMFYQKLEVAVIFLKRRILLMFRQHFGYVILFPNFQFFRFKAMYNNYPLYKFRHGVLTGSRVMKLNICVT
jgi:hypothetical protein